MHSKHYTEVKKVLWLILFANMVVAALKVFVGMLIQSASLMADGFHSVTDGTSNLVGLIGVHFAEKPEDEDHPYGHKKFETLAGLFIAGMLFFIAGKIVVTAIGRFIDPVVPEVSLVSLLALLFTLVINIVVARYERRKGEALHSEILVSDSIHTASDVYVSIGVLVTLIGVKLGLPAIIDPIASLVVAFFVVQAAYEIFKPACGILADERAVDTGRVEEIAMAFSEVKNTHKIRSRGTDNNLHIDMHIMVDPGQSVEAAHKLIHDIEDKMQEELGRHTQVIIHIEPYYEHDASQS